MQKYWSLTWKLFVTRELRTGAQGLARLPSADPTEGEASLQPDAGDAVRALRRELADLAGSVGDAAAHADGMNQFFIIAACLVFVAMQRTN